MKLSVAAGAAALMAVTSPVRAQLVRSEYTELHLGMAVRLVLYAPSRHDARQAASAAFGRIAELEDVLSDWRAGSEVSRLAGAADGVVALSAPLCLVLARALELAGATGGAFDPTVGSLALLWRDARRAGRPPGSAALDSALTRVGWRSVALDPAACTVRLARPGIRFDLGGIAKGYILDQALAVLRARGVSRAMIEAGGDVVVGAAPPGRRGWRISVPEARADIVARAAVLANAAVAISGDWEQHLDTGGVRYSHVLDPRTGLGLTRREQAVVIAPDGLTADGLATALTLVPPGERAALVARFPGVAADVRVTAARP